jgi:hypothetical protein
MGDKRQLRYVVRFIVLCWIAIAAFDGIVIGLARISKNTTLTIILVQVVIYSFVFGFLGWQQYKWKGERKTWHHGKDNRNWRDFNSAKSDDTEESDNGWK